MKKRTALIGSILTSFFFLTTYSEIAMSEVFSCVNQKTGSKPSFRRAGNKFIETIIIGGDTEVYKHLIVDETNEYIVIFQTLPYEGAYVTFLNKNNQTYSSNIIYKQSKITKFANSSGSCSVNL